MGSPSTVDTTEGEPRSSMSSQGTNFTPPSPPNPSEDRGVIPRISDLDPNAPSPPIEGLWDPDTMAPETAMKMLCRSVSALARATGDIPPTPPLSRSGTPRPGFYAGKENGGRHHMRTKSGSRPATPICSEDVRKANLRHDELGSPEAHMHEPVHADVGFNSEPVYLQQMAIARKFYSKKAPPITLEEYLRRLQRFCPMSTAVYLAAGVYIYKLACEERVVPVTSRTAHRLVLAALRVAMKALEDLRYPQARFAGVGGVNESELKMLEISVCYLTNFELQVDRETLYRKTMRLQQAADQILAVRSKLPTTFEPKLPLRARQQISAA